MPTLSFEDLFGSYHQRPMPYKRLRLFRIIKWGGGDSSEGAKDEREETTSLDNADVVTSEFRSSGAHMVVLDLDVPAALVPSSTPGHSHLYIESFMSWDKYEKLLDALGDAGVLQPGYVGASKARKCTAVRLPWVTKEVDPFALPMTDPF